MKRVLAFDIGASSGRAILAEYDGRALTYREVYRFENRSYSADGVLRWDLGGLMAQIRLCIGAAGPVDSIGFDTWGVDFGLLDRAGRLIEDPVHYRDGRGGEGLRMALSAMPEDLLYRATGNQIMEINSLFRLLWIQTHQPELWQRTQRVLFMPDLIAYLLCGISVCERTIASTSQMLDPKTGTWSDPVLGTYKIPWQLFPPLVKSGTPIGTYAGAKVITVAGHDTQCAVAAMPLQGDGEAAFLSCGTWSLLGCELDAPILSAESRRAQISNEQGANGKINYLKNIIGLWLIQESRRQWEREGARYSYAELEQMALAEPAWRCFIDPDAPEFVAPGNIPERIRQFCRRTGQPVPQTVGQVMRCIYESLALKYRYTLLQLETLTGKRFSTLHVLGGGAKDGLLCRMTADCTGKRVLAGPVEATALGNVLIQLASLGALESLDQGRKLVSDNESVSEFTPDQMAAWGSAYAAYQSIIG